MVCENLYIVKNEPHIIKYIYIYIQIYEYINMHVYNIPPSLSSLIQLLVQIPLPLAIGELNKQLKHNHNNYI